MLTLCRDCCETMEGEPQVCEHCGSHRLRGHPELASLETAHIDCDAFYAAVEKRDDPSLRDKPVIIGGGKRGVVSTCCYIARTFGIRSAMPMFQALPLCPDATIIRPDMAKYSRVGRQVRAMMARHGIKSVAAPGFQAPGVVVSFTDDNALHTGKGFLAEGVQSAAGVPLQCDEGADFRTFRIGLFGLEKLHHVDRTVAHLAAALDRVGLTAPAAARPASPT